MYAGAVLTVVATILPYAASGDPGLPPSLGWVGVLPCMAGLLAVIALWRRS
jgi:hypothetical protein